MTELPSVCSTPSTTTSGATSDPGIHLASRPADPSGRWAVLSRAPYGDQMMIRRSLAMLATLVSLWAPVAQAQSVTGTVTRVVDGDTVDVRVDAKVERIRIIGLDTPETVDPRKAVQCFGREASAHAKELLPLGTVVILETDPTQDRRDRYGRMLAFILFETEPGITANFTEVMIAGGYGHHYIYRRPSIYADAFAMAQGSAQSLGLGLWGAETCAGQAYPKRDLEDDGDVPASVSLVPVTDDAQSGMEAIPGGTMQDDAPPPAPDTAPVPGRKQSPLTVIATPTERAVRSAVPTPTARATPVGGSTESFDPSGFIGKGDAYNCNAFSSQAQAQAVLRADPRDPNKLDPDRDGVACESNRAPKDTSPVKR